MEPSRNHARSYLVPHSSGISCTRLLGTVVAKPRAEFTLEGDSILFTRSLALGLASILLSMSLGSLPIYAQIGADSQAALKARADVAKLGVGSNAQVEVKLRDDSKLKGYISEARDDSFTVTDPKKGTSETVSYTEVTQIKKAGRGWSTRNWLILGGAAAAAVTTWVIIKPALCDGGAQTRGPC